MQDFADSYMFDYPKIYENAVRNANPGATFVEIGSCFGHSTRYMAQLIKDSHKDIKFYAVDPWEFIPPFCPDHIFKKISQMSRSIGIYMTFLDNLKQADVLKYVTPMKMTSTLASKLFKNDEVDFIMIDGDHTYSGVKEDIGCWSDKIKDGGVMAGHDFQVDGVSKAVVEKFNEDGFFKYIQSNTTPILKNSICWLTQKDGLIWKPYYLQEEDTNGISE